jgi:hypothetical protein
MVQRHGFSLAAVAAATLVACGGGGAGDSGTTAPTSTSTNPTPASVSTYLDGTAAYGAPLALAKVTITDANGKTVTVTASDTGTYKADVTGMKAPLLVTATAESGDAVRVYRALVGSDLAAGSTGHANVTQLTDAIVALASSDGSTPGEFAGADKLKNLDPARLQKAHELVKTLVKDVATATGNASYDPVTAAFTADGASSGDKLLDMVKLSIDQSGVTLRVVGVPAAPSPPSRTPPRPHPLHCPHRPSPTASPPSTRGWPASTNAWPCRPPSASASTRAVRPRPSWATAPRSPASRPTTCTTATRCCSTGAGSCTTGFRTVP